MRKALVRSHLVLAIALATTGGLVGCSSDADPEPTGSTADEKDPTASGDDQKVQKSEDGLTSGCDEQCMRARFFAARRCRLYPWTCR